MNEVAPDLLEYLPEKQGVHVLGAPAPVLSEYFPEAHSVHVSTVIAAVKVEYFPLEHATQVVSLVADILTEYFPGTQEVHCALPVVLLYFPATHAVQLPPSNPVYPVLQTHAMISPLPWAECELGRHD